MTKSFSFNHRMYNLYTKFVKILEIYKQYSKNLVDEHVYIPHRKLIPKFSNFEVIDLSLVAETESNDGEKL